MKQLGKVFLRLLPLFWAAFILTGCDNEKDSEEINPDGDSCDQILDQCLMGISENEHMVQICMDDYNACQNNEDEYWWDYDDNEGGSDGDTDSDGDADEGGGSDGDTDSDGDADEGGSDGDTDSDGDADEGGSDGDTDSDTDADEDGSLDGEKLCEMEFESCLLEAAAAKDLSMAAECIYMFEDCIEDLYNDWDEGEDESGDDIAEMCDEELNICMNEVSSSENSEITEEMCIDMYEECIGDFNEGNDEGEDTLTKGV